MNHPNYDLLGYALAARVLQSDLYAKLDDLERAQCDELIARGQGRNAPEDVHFFERAPEFDRRFLESLLP